MTVIHDHFKYTLTTRTVLSLEFKEFKRILQNISNQMRGDIRTALTNTARIPDFPNKF